MSVVMIAGTAYSTIVDRGVAVNTRRVVLGVTKASGQVNISLP